MRVRAAWIFVGLAVAGVTAVLRWVELTPRVESDFFFAEEDPQLQATAAISRRFPSPDQIVVRAAYSGDDAAAYRARVGDLATAFRAVPGVTAVYSIATEDTTSPLWGRLLPTRDPRATNLILQVDATDPAVLVPGIEAVTARHETPTLSLEVSGVPYVVELIRRHLYRDFVTFSLAALLVFGATVWLVSRRWLVVLGTVTACLTTCAVTLSLTHVLGIAIGLLTANIVTIVFVLTLSHIVFLTANWRRATVTPWESRPADVAAVRLTVGPSAWCMVTTMLGFLSLLLASARPLRELGLAGALGTITAMAIAYGVYPAFLRALESRAPRAAPAVAVSQDTESSPSRGRGWLVGAAAVALVLTPGMFRVDTDPSLLSYFAGGSELREGLEAIDRDGGSSTLDMIVRLPGGGRLDGDEAIERMWAFQDLLEADAAVGVVLSPPVILAHARRQPLAGFLNTTQLLDLLERPLFGGIALSFIRPERDEGRFFIRMREAGRGESRAAVVARLRGAAERAGLEVVTTGGVYELQGQLGHLIARSLRFGLGGLIVLFVGVAFIVARRGAVAAAMVACLATIPIVVLGAIGWAGLPVDIITSPAANVALAMGVDSMIHLVTRVRALREAGAARWEAWGRAGRQLRAPILGATLIICAGFGIFGLSAFPPTRRFGLAVILGTAAAATLALVVLPALTRGGPAHRHAPS